MCACSKKDDGQVAHVGVGLDLPGKLIPVHLGHHDVRDNQVKILTGNDLQRLDTVVRCKHTILLAQQGAHEHQQFDIVFDNQNLVGFIVARVDGSRQVLWRFVGCGEQFLDIEYCRRRSVEHQLVALVNLGGRERILVDGYRNNKYGALALFALTVDGSSMQIDEIAGQGETEPRAKSLHRAVVTIVETLEQPLHLLRRNAYTGIAHLDNHMIIGLIGGGS